MNCGRIDLWDVFQFGSLLDPTQVDPGTTLSGTAESVYVEPVSRLVTSGVKLYSQITNTGTYALTARLRIPALGVAPADWTDTVLGPIEQAAQVLDARLDVYPDGFLGKFVYSWSDILWIVNGSTVYSDGPGSLAAGSISPMEWPLVGCGAFFTGGATLNAGVPTDPPIPTGTNSESRAEGSFTGGWKKQDSGVWVTVPVNLSKSPLPVPDGCTCQIGSEPVLECTDSYDAQIVSLAREFQTSELVETLDCDCPPGCTQVGQPQYSHYRNTAGFEFAEAWIYVTPDLSKYVRRLFDKAGDYRAFWGRYRMPEVKRVRSATCKVGADPLGFGEVSYPFYEETVTHPRQAEIIGVVGETTHAMEDTFSYPTLAPYQRTYAKHVATADVYEFVVGSGRCIVGIDCGGLEPCFEDTYSYCLLDSSEGIAGAEAGNCLPILDCGSAVEQWRAVGTYANTWANPHWSYRYHIEDWELLGSPAFWIIYWGLIGSQWLYNPALPLFEQRRTRNSIIESPLEASFLKFFQGLYYLGRWLGVSRFYVDTAEAPLSVAMGSGSSAAWSATGATLAFGANIAATVSATSVTVDYDIGRFDAAPYQFPHIANRVNVNWSGATITSVSVRLVSADGSTEVEIGTATGDLDLKSFSDVKYAGSWAIDNGAGYLSDLGFDDGPHVADGESTAVMADNERVGSFNYLSVFNGGKLRFVFTLSSVANFTLEYPTFKRTAVSPYPARESRQATVLMWADGPMVRFGNHRYLLSVSPPTVQGEGAPPTAVDYLCWKRQWWLGVSETGGSPNLATELASIFDAAEGNAVADADEFTNAFVLPRALLPLATKSTVLAAVVNSFREIPPLSMAPTKARNSRYQETGDYVLEVFSFAQEPRRFVTQGSVPLVFEDPSGTPWSTVETGWPANAKVSSYIHQVDNSEGYGYVTKDGTLYGRVRWRGVLAIVSTTKAEGSGPWNWEDERGRYHRVDTNGSDVVYHGVDWCRPYPGFDREVAVGAGKRPKVFKDRVLSRLYVVYDDDTDSHLTWSDDAGLTWNTPIVSIANSSHHTGNSSPFDGTVVVAALRYVSGSSGPLKIVGKSWGPGDATFGSEFTFKDSAAADIEFEAESFHIFPAYDGARRWILTAKGYGNTHVDEWESFDGCATWSLI